MERGRRIATLALHSSKRRPTTSRRGHASPVEWLEECLRRGWPADEARLLRVLDALRHRITEQGGQRRARAYLAAQKRRLVRRAA